MNKTVRLKEIAEVITGFPFKSELYSNIGIKTIRGENVTEGNLRWDTIKCWDRKFEKQNDYLLRENDIVIAMDGSKVGKNKARIKKSDLPLLLAQRVACVRAKKGNNQIFLYYLINNPRFEEYVFKAQTGSSVPHISKTQIENFEVPDLASDDQKKIASILSVLDDKIELNNRINSELEQMARNLYDYWFVQFDFPNAKEKPYKSSGGKMIYNKAIKREVPEGWEVECLGKLNTILVRGISPKYVESNGVPVVNQRCIRNGVIDYSFCRLHNTQQKPLNKLLEIGDILVNSTGVGTLGRVAMVKRLENPITTADSHVTIVRIDPKKANPLFIGVSMLQKQNEIEKLGEGSTGQTELSRGNLGNLNLLLPLPKIQERFESIVKPLFEKTAINEIQNQQLSALRDWLLPMLMNGQAKVTAIHSSQKELQNIAAEPEPEYKKRTQLNIFNEKKGFAKQVLAGKIVSRFKDDPHFTDIKFQKIQFLAEHIIQADLNLNYYYQAAGPYDNVFMHTIYDALKKNKWYDYKNKKFAALEKQNKIDEYYQGYFGAATGQLDKLFRLLENETEATSEIIATIYAVWNNFIKEKKPVTDTALIEGFYSWSQRKQQYTKPQIVEGLQWLRINHLEPTGFGKLIKKAKGKK